MLSFPSPPTIYWLHMYECNLNGATYLLTLGTYLYSAYVYLFTSPNISAVITQCIQVNIPKTI